MTIVTYDIRADSQKLESGHPIGLPKVRTRRRLVLSHNGQRTRSEEMKAASINTKWLERKRFGLCARPNGDVWYLSGELVTPQSHIGTFGKLLIYVFI